MDEYEKSHPKGRSALDEFNEAAKMRKSKHIPKKSPYTVTIFMQIQACVIRAYQRMWGDKSTLGATYAANIIMSLVIGSVFYNTPENTSGFFSKVVQIFLTLQLTIGWGYVLRDFVQCFYRFGGNQSTIQPASDHCKLRSLYLANWKQKHKSQALYRPSADALATYLADIPVKLLSTTIFDLVLYFMTGLSRTGDPLSLSSLTDSWAILYVLSLHVHGLALYGFNLPHHSCFDRDSGTSAVYCRHNGACYRQLCWLLDPSLVHASLVRMDFLHQPCLLRI